MSERLSSAVWFSARRVGLSFVAFVAAAVLFAGMMSLREWKGQYAASAEWADTVSKEQLKWSPVVAQAARAMADATGDPSSTRRKRASATSCWRR